MWVAFDDGLNKTAGDPSLSLALIDAEMREREISPVLALTP